MLDARLITDPEVRAGLASILTASRKDSSAVPRFKELSASFTSPIIPSAVAQPSTVSISIEKGLIVGVTPMGETDFTAALGERGFTRGRKRVNGIAVRGWWGLRLLAVGVA